MELQLEKKAKGDRESTYIDTLNRLEISESLEDIRNMTKYKFIKIQKVKIRKFVLT